MSNQTDPLYAKLPVTILAGRPFKIALGLLLLAALLIATRAWGAALDTSDADSQAQTHLVYLPVALANFPSGIGGLITFDGQPSAGTELTLYLFDDDQWSPIETTTTGAGGQYLFADPDSLGNGQMYYVRFGPNESDPTYLFSWYGPLIEDFSEHDYADGGNFDIVDVPLISPVDGAQQTLPTTFTWDKRDVSSDTYRVAVLDFETDDKWTTIDFGYEDSGTINGLANGMVFNRLYNWYVEVYAEPDSFGESFMINEITFENSAAQQARNQGGATSLEAGAARGRGPASPHGR